MKTTKIKKSTMRVKKMKQKIIKQKLNVLTNIDIKQIFEKKNFYHFRRLKNENEKTLKRINVCF